MTTIRVKLSTATCKELFIAVRSILHELKHSTVKNQSRRSVPVMNLVQMSELYVAQSSDNVRPTAQGDWSLKRMSPEDFLHVRSSWEDWEFSGITYHTWFNMMLMEKSVKHIWQ